MELRHLRYFVALAETLNFTRAAETLYISQSTLSQQIADLEQELGVKLFERTKRKVELTDAGREILNDTRHILAEVEVLSRTGSSTGGDSIAQRTVRVGIDTRAMGSQFLRKTISDRIFELRDEVDELKATFRNGEYDTILGGLKDGSLDIAFFLHQKPRVEGVDGIESCCLYPDELALAIRTPDELEEGVAGIKKVLARRGVTLLEGEGRGLLQAMRIFDELGVEPEIHFASDRQTMLLEANSGERAIVFPLGLASRQLIEGTRVLRFGVDEALLYVTAAWRTDNTNPFVDEIVAAVERAMEPWLEIRRKELAGV